MIKRNGYSSEVKNNGGFPLSHIMIDVLDIFPTTLGKIHLPEVKSNLSSGNLEIISHCKAS